MKIIILSPLTIPLDSSFKKLIPNEPLAYKKVHPHPWVTNLAYGLSHDKNHQVHIVTLTSNVNKDIVFIHKNISYHLLKSSPKFIRKITLNFIDNLKVQKYIKSLNPDIVHGQGRQTDGLSAVKSNFPSIITSHGEIENELLSYKKNIKYSIKKYFENKVNKKMKFAIGVSQDTVTNLKKFLPEENVFLIDNALDPVFFDKYNLEWNPIVFYAGAISPRKRIFELIKTVEQLKDIKLHIATQTPKDNTFYKKVIEYVTLNKLNNKIIFLENLTPKQIAQEISKCLCTVLISNFESFGMPLAEAMSIGKPVIGSRTGGIPYLINENKTGFLIEPGNINQLKEKINLLHKDINLAKEMGKAAAENAYNRWHPFKVAEKTLKAYTFAITKGN